MENNIEFKHLTLPLSRKDAEGLRAGDYVMLSGVMYTARDAAHKRMSECLKEGSPLPVGLAGETIYYVGPCFGKDGKAKGAGPTTSGRMDAYAPALYDCGVIATVGIRRPGHGSHPPHGSEGLSRHSGHRRPRREYFPQIKQEGATLPSR